MSQDRRRPQQEPQARQKHPDAYQHDLDPDHLKGQNIGRNVPGVDAEEIRAGDVKELRNELSDFTREELEQIRVVRAGARLHQGATYLDLRTRTEIHGMGGDVVPDGAVYVVKAGTPWMLWNRLTGETSPQRTI